MKKLTADNVQYFFSPDVKPVISIIPPETVIVDTLDAAAGIIRTEGDICTPEEMERRGIGGANPVSGPIFVEGAEPGDNLVVHIKEIKCGGTLHQGFTEVVPGFGGLSGPYSILPPLQQISKICPIEGNEVLFPLKHKKTIRIPLNPVVGTIGVAPRAERIGTVYHGQEFGGNIDSPDARVGNKIILRTNVRGGLLSLGDVAAVTGDGELSSAHVDTEAQVTLDISLIKKKDAQYVDWPQIDFPDGIGSVSCPFGGSLDDAYRAAYCDLTLRLVRFYGFDLIDAYQLLSAVGEIRVNQGFDPNWYSCTARIARRYIA